MVAIPTSPKCPTVYVVGERSDNSALRSLIEIALKTLKAGSCTVEDLPIAPDVSAADRGAILEFLRDEYSARGTFIAGQASQFLDEAIGAYDEIDDACLLLGEVGVVVRRPGQLRAAVPRLGTAKITTDQILPKDRPEILILDADLDARAVAAAIAMGGVCNARPQKVTIASTDAKGPADVRQRIAGQGRSSRVSSKYANWKAPPSMTACWP